MLRLVERRQGGVRKEGRKGGNRGGGRGPKDESRTRWASRQEANVIFDVGNSFSYGVPARNKAFGTTELDIQHEAIPIPSLSENYHAFSVAYVPFSSRL